MSAEPSDRTDLERKLDGVLKQQRELIERLQQGQDYFQQLARSVWRVQEDERRRLAHELHDGVGHSLTALIHLMAQATAALAGKAFAWEQSTITRSLTPALRRIAQAASMSAAE